MNWPGHIKSVKSCIFCDQVFTKHPQNMVSKLQLDYLIPFSVFFLFFSWKRLTGSNEEYCAFNQMSGLDISPQAFWWDAFGNSGHVELHRAVTAVPEESSQVGSPASRLSPRLQIRFSFALAYVHEHCPRLQEGLPLPRSADCAIFKAEILTPARLSGQRPELAHVPFSHRDISHHCNSSAHSHCKILSTSPRRFM